jgi:hypothetical protein
MHDPRPRRHEKSSRDLTGKAENEKRNTIEFPERRKAASPSDELFGIEERELSTNEQFPDKPKLELLPPEKILLGFAVVVAVIMLGVLLLLLITWPT